MGQKTVLIGHCLTGEISPKSRLRALILRCLNLPALSCCRRCPSRGKKFLRELPISSWC
ncbi:hypothetical protein DAI22_08g163600 [Oryza sativa Japonica Group]|nr:hypothetical protein DAI22_08g163600 [Oryza sativa Japonica Group]